jgi:hypothetical protein
MQKMAWLSLVSGITALYGIVPLIIESGFSPNLQLDIVHGADHVHKLAYVPALVQRTYVKDSEHLAGRGLVFGQYLFRTVHDDADFPVKHLTVVVPQGIVNGDDVSRRSDFSILPA